MVESKSFEMLELLTGEIVLRAVGDEDNFLLKVEFDETVSSALGSRKIEVCREMIVAGIEAAQELQSQRPRALSWSDLNSKEREKVIGHFAECAPNDLSQYRVLH